MELIRKATEDEMLFAFLRGELRSERFSGDLRAALSALKLPETLITDGQLTSDEENKQRRDVMSAFRGYPDRELFEEYPRNTLWALVRFHITDLERLRYITYCYWDELSGGTSSPLEAARSIRAGITVYNVPNDRFWRASDYLQAGGSFDPIILLANGDTCTILEGHLRATAYAMNPACFQNTIGYVGFSNEDDMLSLINDRSSF